jgi:peroxiredoxin (alkyl hydroperoxide reductase subunit C)
MFIQKKAPNFKADALLPNGSFKEITLSDFEGKKYVLLFFYPLNFTFVCPSEIISFSNKMNDFNQRDTAVIGVSVDSKFSHLAWTKLPIGQGGIGKINMPLISDLNKKISNQYDVLLNDSVAVRATVLIDKQGVIRYYSLNDLPLGRNIEEVIRIVDALQYTEKHGEVCPAGWRKGKDAIKPNADGIDSYLKNNSSTL